MSNSELTRIAVVGAGSRAHAHLDAIARLTDLYTLVGVSDADPQRRDDAAGRYGAPAFATVEEMLDSAKPEVLVIVVPPDGHHAMAEAAAVRGVHVITEVPIATTMPLADAMIATAERHGVLLEVAENVWRWPIEQLKQQIVAAGVIGRVTQAHLWYSSGSYHGISAIRKAVGGQPTRVLGVAADIEGPERVDLMGQPQRVRPWELGVVEFDNGVTCVYQQPAHRARPTHWEIVGTAGYIDYRELVLGESDPQRFPIERITRDEDPHSTLLALRVGADPEIVWENPYQHYDPASDDEIALIDVLVKMRTAILSGGGPGYGAANGRTDQEILLALRESASLGSTWIDLPLTAPTGVEQIMHAEYRARYGADPLAGVRELADASFARQGVNQYAHADAAQEGPAL
jgi:predicted dehydrogenase